ncbi:hypothetical protein [Halorussus lipolyticus]|nr:hypothetical protein [Halorussus sp. DT80]
MQFDIETQTEDETESTKPVAPGTSCYDCLKPGNSLNVFSFLL